MPPRRIGVQGHCSADIYKLNIDAASGETQRRIFVVHTGAPISNVHDQRASPSAETVKRAPINDPPLVMVTLPESEDLLADGIALLLIVIAGGSGISGW